MGKHVFKSRKSLHSCLKAVLIVAQMFSFLPVQGVASDDVNKLKFSWLHWRTAYSLLGAGGTFCFLVFNAMLIQREGGTVVKMGLGGLVFYGCSFASNLLFLDLARKWPGLMTKWAQVEFAMYSYGWPSSSMKRKIHLLAGIFVTLAAVEHVLLHLNNYLVVKNCADDPEQVVKFYFVYTYPDAFAAIDYNIWRGLALEAINIICTFSWTFVNLFIMLMSIALSERFQQVNFRLHFLVESRIGNELSWANLRNDYSRLCTLCADLNDNISTLIIISFANNLFFVLLQLFNMLRKMTHTLEKIYFFFSFGFLLYRTICVCLYGASVNDESKRSFLLLNSIPSSLYNREIHRLIQQIGFDDTCLNGKNFFNITRSLIVSIAGAIVTYELVLIQFQGNLLQENFYNNTIC